MAWERQCFEDISKKDHLLNHYIHDKGVCRIAQATMVLGKHYVTQGHFCTQFLVFSNASEKQLLMLIY
jgi:hypothetical protein